MTGILFSNFFLKFFLFHVAFLKSFFQSNFLDPHSNFEKNAIRNILQFWYFLRVTITNVLNKVFRGWGMDNQERL